jgi:hypothetical protein
MPATYEPLATTTLGSDTASVTFSSISGSYTDLILIIAAQNNTGVGYNNTLVFNSDTTSNYSFTRVTGNGSVAASARFTNQSYAYGGFSNNTASVFALSINHIQNYSNATTYKNILTRTGDLSDGRVAAYVSLWRKSPEAITSIKVEPEGSAIYKSGSTFSLYGIKSA